MAKSKKQIKVAFAPEMWGFVPSIKAKTIIDALQKITQRTRTSLLNEACEKMEKG
jgi:hypothetical protein